MVIEEVHNTSLIRHYSDNGMKIRQVETGMVYNDAVDLYPCRYAYEETDLPVEYADIPDNEALDIITGGDADDSE